MRLPLLLTLARAAEADVPPPSDFREAARHLAGALRSPIRVHVPGQRLLAAQVLRGGPAARRTGTRGWSAACRRWRTRCCRRTQSSRRQQGDPALLKLGRRRRGLHFPQTNDGVYAGYHPRDAAAAVRHLEELRRKGAEYLVLPATAFWWLEHYVGLNRHLDALRGTPRYAEDILHARSSH